MRYNSLPDEEPVHRPTQAAHEPKVEEPKKTAPKKVLQFATNEFNVIEQMQRKALRGQVPLRPPEVVVDKDRAPGETVIGRVHTGYENC